MRHRWNRGAPAFLLALPTLLTMPYALNATAWQLAQLASPMTWLTCHPMHLASEAAPLWLAQQFRAVYFQRNTETAFDAISNSLQAVTAN